MATSTLPTLHRRRVCTIGGNVAENAGGAHCLKYGFTTTHVLALEVVLPTGELVHLGSSTLGRARLRSRRRLRRLGRNAGRRHRGHPAHREAAGRRAGAAGRVRHHRRRRADRLRHHRGVHSSSGHGDHGPPRPSRPRRPRSIPTIPHCEALLLVELDGPRAEVELQMRAGPRALPRERRLGRPPGTVRAVNACSSGRAARPPSPPPDASRPTTSCRMASFHAPSCRSSSKRSARWPRQTGLRVTNVFHAGDGNLHPIVLYDASIPGEEERASTSPCASCSCASISAAPSPANTAWAARSSSPWATCTPSPTSTPCSSSATPSIPTTSPTPTSSFRARAFAAKRPGLTRLHPLETAGVAEYF